MGSPRDSAQNAKLRQEDGSVVQLGVQPDVEADPAGERPGDEGNLPRGLRIGLGAGIILWIILAAGAWLVFY